MTLLEAIAAGDEAALGQLMTRHQDKLFNFAYRFVRSEEDAAEIVSETFIRVYRHAANYRPRAKVATWIYSITSNLCRDHHRRQKRWHLLSLFSTATTKAGNEGTDLEERIPSKDPAADESLLRSEAHEILLKHIDTLPPKLKASFILHVLEDHSQKACAEILGVTEKTIETRIYRARKQLQAALLNTAQ